MKNITVSILENQPIYGQRLAAFLGRHEHSPFVPRLYLEHPIGEKEEADIYVLTSSLLDHYPHLGEEGMLLVLDEKGSLCGSMKGAVYKYQSAEQIYQVLEEMCIEGSDKYKIISSKERTVDLLVRFDLSREGEKAFYQMLRRMAEKEKILYMDLAFFPATELYSEEEETEEGISDLIFYMKQGKTNMGRRLERMVNGSGFHYLKPAQMPMEISEMTAEEWDLLLKILKEETDYDKVFLDFGRQIPPKAVAMLADSFRIDGDEADPYIRARLDQYEQAIRQLAGRELRTSMSWLLKEAAYGEL